MSDSAGSRRYDDLAALLLNRALRRSPGVAGWTGEDGPSSLDPGSGGIPAHGDRRSAWDAGCRPDFPNPEHR
jgi:hypothetical protein